MSITKYKNEILAEAYQAATQTVSRAEDKIANAAKAEALVLIASQIDDNVTYLSIRN